MTGRTPFAAVALRLVMAADVGLHGTLLLRPLTVLSSALIFVARGRVAEDALGLVTLVGGAAAEGTKIHGMPTEGHPAA